MIAVHQFLPGYRDRDAIGRHTLRIQRLLHRHGIASEVYAEHFDDAPGPCRPFREFGGDPTGTRATLLYHHSVGSPVADFVLGRPERLVVDYHNVTPAAIVTPWEPSIGPVLERGRRQLRALVRRATLAIADSTYNADECLEVGFRRCTVVPILLDTEHLLASDGGAEPASMAATGAARGRERAEWLFVGRLAPNKAQHELLAALALARRVGDGGARLTLVGATSSDAYGRALEGYAGALGVRDVVDLAGDVGDVELARRYRAADVFVCASVHEGFCVPLLEAMAADLPVVATANAAVPETLGAAGVLVPRRGRALLAAAAQRVARDAALRARLVRAGRARLDDFAPARTEAKLLQALEPLLAA